MSKKNLVILSGAGMSAESGIKTFRDDDGLWEGHDVMAVASIDGWHKDPELVLDFYNQRRKQLLTVEPNEGHKIIAALENQFEVTVVTQNVDDLHERAGSSNVIHLHGELLKSRSSVDENLVYECRNDIVLGDKCELGTQIRPFIVWFGEMVPMLDQAVPVVENADVIVIVGTSMQVYPAASLAGFAKPDTPIYYIDLNPAVNDAVAHLTNLTVIKDTASSGLNQLKEILF